MTATVPTQVLELFHILSRTIDRDKLTLASIATETRCGFNAFAESVNRGIKVAYEKIVDVRGPSYIITEPHDSLITG